MNDDEQCQIKNISEAFTDDKKLTEILYYVMEHSKLLFKKWSNGNYNKLDSEDFSQDISLKISKYFRKQYTETKQIKHFDNWLRAICWNHKNNQDIKYKNKFEHPSLDKMTNYGNEKALKINPTIESKIDEKTIYYNLINSLPSKQKEAIKLTFEGYTIKEIAEFEKSNTNTIKSRMLLGRKYLKENETEIYTELNQNI
ncbi:MAG: sigma-70 family RNA polymerase sigma factor [Patescibacteria group bacterium]|nr:sigma-70 family RNA polymerase sigma factor [Patescibacteria group bacterium]